MKTRALFILLLIGGMALVWSCATTPGGKPTGFVKDEHGIVIPATPFSEGDQTAMNKILAKYDTELYKIETHVNGEFQKRRGTLRDMFTDKALAASIAENVKKQGFTRSAVRVGSYTASDEGAAVNPEHTSGPSATPVGTGANPHLSGPSATPVGTGANPHLTGPSATGANPHRVQQDQLISELTPILEKYNK